MGQGFWGGFPPAALAIPAAVAPEGGACFFGRLSPLPLAYLSAPYPPDPLPGGKGETKVISCKGLRPLHPQN